MNAPAGKARPRSHVRIMVFNGNGRSGAAGAEASAPLSTSATRSPAPRTRATRTTRRASSCTGPGFRAEGMRLAKDLGVKVVGPLDGIRAAALCTAAQLAVIVGAGSAQLSTSACPSSPARASVA